MSTAFDISPDGSFIVYATNEAGMSKVKILDTRTDKVRVVEGLPAGIAGGFDIVRMGRDWHYLHLGAQCSGCI